MLFTHNNIIMSSVQVPVYPTWFNIKFDGEGDVQIEAYRLLVDCAADDLQLIINHTDRAGICWSIKHLIYHYVITN